MYNSHTLRGMTGYLQAVIMKRSLVPQIDIRNGIIPITRAAANLAEFVKKAKEGREPFLITQNGYPAAVIIDVESYANLCELAEQAVQQAVEQLDDASSDEDPVEEMPLKEAEVNNI